MERKSKRRRRSTGGEQAATEQAVAPSGGSEGVAQEKQEDEQSLNVSKFLKSWAWKREHRPDRDRFHRPYLHPLVLPDGSTQQLSLKQAKFSAVGFASTVWDSSIVVAKWLEAHPARVQGAQVLDLSAGCGLVGIVAARLGAARVVLTDLEPNLPLLRDNCEANASPAQCSGAVHVVEHTWGQDVAPLQPPFDLVLAQDVMYVREAVPDLMATLKHVCRQCSEDHGKSPVSGGCQGSGDAHVTADNHHRGEQQGVDRCGAVGAPVSPCKPTHVILAHGRNRFAEADFMAAAADTFTVQLLGEQQLHPEYQCSDVAVHHLTLKAHQQWHQMQ